LVKTVFSNRVQIDIVKTILDIENLVRRFGGLVATDNVSFSIEQGTSVGLIGPNGAGKTTIFSQIMGEIRQDAGHVRLFGEEISKLSTPARIREGVSRTYQVPRPFAELSVAENISIGLMPDSLLNMIRRGNNPERELELALSVGFKASDLNSLAQELSMGDLRKLEMARTLATAPRLLLLDEVFAGLTVGEISQISELIQRLRMQQMSFLIVSHDLKSLEPLVDVVIALDKGRIIEQGGFAEVIGSDAVRQSYIGIE